MGPCPTGTRDGITLFLADVSFTCGQGSRVKETNSASRMLPAAKQDRLRRRSHRALGRQSHRASATSGEAGVVIVPCPRQTAGLQQMRHQATLPSSSQSASIIKGWSLTAATIALMVAALSMLRRGRAGASNGTMLRCSRRPHAPGASCRDMGWLGLLTMSRGPGRSQCERSIWASRLV